MKKVITNIISFTAILLFLASSTGISFVIHHCYTAQTEHIKFFADTYKCKTETEIEKPHASCCCEKHNAASEDKSLIHLGKSECCKNTYQFLKINYQYESGVSTVKQLISIIPVFININFSLDDNNKYQDYQQLYHPPPLLMVGKYLIHFIHNLKIPFADL
ncbi:MAG: hypothetical protein ACOYO1_18955 [Bacteroidales bacterium]